MRAKLAGVVAAVAVALVGVAAPATAQMAGNEHFVIIARLGNFGVTSCRVAATGPVSGAGTCTVDQVSETVTVVHLLLPGGTVDLTATQTENSDQFNPQTCVGRFTFTESWEITGATGAYAGATGSGTDKGTGVFHGPPQHCDPSQSTGQIVARGTGTVSIGGQSAAA
jgi:hypothetical protein